MQALLEYLLPRTLYLLHLHLGKKVIECHVKPKTLQASCPLCGVASITVHSHYERTVLDIPMVGHPLRLRLQVRKFFCSNLECQRKVFCERLPEVVKAYGRKTLRFYFILQNLTLQMAAETCSRAVNLLGLYCCPDTLLTYARQYQPKLPSGVNIGMDDWAKRKGVRYGSIMVDLDSRRVMDLVTTREQVDLRPWMEQHPEIQLVARDRGRCYQDVTERGGVIAVSDRFHLIQNLTTAFERCVQPHFKDLGRSL